MENPKKDCDCRSFNWYKDPGPDGRHHPACAVVNVKLEICSKCQKPVRIFDLHTGGRCPECFQKSWRLK